MTRRSRHKLTGGQTHGHTIRRHPRRPATGAQVNGNGQSPAPAEPWPEALQPASCTVEKTRIESYDATTARVMPLMDEKRNTYFREYMRRRRAKMREAKPELARSSELRARIRDLERLVEIERRGRLAAEGRADGLSAVCALADSMLRAAVLHHRRPGPRLTDPRRDSITPHHLIPDENKVSSLADAGLTAKDNP
jgi:hypothetical protein